MIEFYKRRYANFSGRATRREYALWFLFVSLFIVGILVLGFFTNNKIGSFFNFYIFNLVLFVPFQAITVRRIRDLGFSGAFVFLNYIPIINLLLIVCLLIIKGENKKNAYGDSPYI